MQDGPGIDIWEYVDFWIYMVGIEWSYDTWGFCKNTFQSEDIEGINLWDRGHILPNMRIIHKPWGLVSFVSGIQDLATYDHQDFEPLSMGISYVMYMFIYCSTEYSNHQIHSSWSCWKFFPEHIIEPSWNGSGIFFGVTSDVWQHWGWFTRNGND